MQATRLRKGMLIKVGEELFRVLELQHVTPGNLRGLRPREAAQHPARARSPTRSSGRKTRSSARTLDEKSMQYLYRDGAAYHFMDTETYEQIALTDEVLGDAMSYLVAESVIKMEFYGSEPVGIELPQTVDLTVVETTPGHQGRDGERAAQAGDARDRPRRAGAAVRQRRRQGPRQHGDRGVPVAGVGRIGRVEQSESGEVGIRTRRRPGVTAWTFHARSRPGGSR